MLVATAAASAIANVLIVGGVPFLVYFAVVKWRRRRSPRQIAARAGLQMGERRYLLYSAGLAAFAVAILIVWPPPLDPYLRAGSPQHVFRGLGVSAPAVVMAMLYGLVQTGFAEELLFRGLIAGSIARRVSPLWADVAQSAIFLVPHALAIRVMPELRSILPIVFAGSLVVGWIRIKSGSIVGPWLVHGSINVTICLSVAARSAP